MLVKDSLVSNECVGVNITQLFDGCMCFSKFFTTRNDNYLEGAFSDGMIDIILYRVSRIRNTTWIVV